MMISFSVSTRNLRDLVDLLKDLKFKMAHVPILLWGHTEYWVHSHQNMSHWYQLYSSIAEVVFDQVFGVAVGSSLIFITEPQCVCGDACLY